MRIEKLELNKIKITLHIEDLKMYNINARKITPDSPELHTFLCEIMKIVQSETNFNPFDGQVVVEATPDGDGLILMLSKIPAQKPRVSRLKAIKKAPDKKNYVYIFSELGQLEIFFKAFPDFDTSKAKLYSINDLYCIVSEVYDRRFAEFCDIQKKNIHISFVEEHGKLIAQGEALAETASFFRGE